MKYDNIKGELFLSKKNLKGVIRACTLTLIMIFIGSYYLDLNIINEKSLDKKEYVIERPQYSVVTLSGSEIPEEITEDTYLAKGIYTVKSDLTIHAGVTLEVEAGSEIKFDSGKKVIINGIIKLNGIEEERISINNSNSNLDFINIESIGVLEATYTDIHNRYKSSNNAINNKGLLKFNNVIITGSINEHNNIINTGGLEIKNSNIAGKIYINEHSDSIVITDNIFDELTVQLNASDEGTFENIKNNYDKNNNPKSIILNGSPEKNVKLYKQNYLIKNELIIEIGITLEIEAGSRISIEQKNKMLINGTMKLIGTESEKINLTHSNNPLGNPFAIVEVGTTGILELTYTNIHNSHTWNAGSNGDVINNKGTAKINNLSATGSSYHDNNIINNGNIEIKNSDIKGYIYINENSGNVILDNNVLDRNISVRGKVTGSVNITNNKVTGSTTYPVSVSLNVADEETFQNIKGNINERNENNSVIELLGEPTGNIKLSKNTYQLPNNITIPENTIFELEKGVHMKIKSSSTTSANEGAIITVKGVLNVLGTESEPVKLTNSSGTSSYWRGIKIESTGTLLSNNLEIRQAGSSSSYPVDSYGQLVMFNSIITNGYVSKGIRFKVTDQEQILLNNAILGNVVSDNMIYAYYNYWGHESGPRRRNFATGGYIGSGFSISDNIVAEPFNTEFEKRDVESIELLRINELRHFGTDGVNSLSGNFSREFNDLNNSEQVDNINIQRTYNSKNKEAGVLGQGWSISLFSRVKENPYNQNSYVVYFPNGSINIFDKQDNNNYVGLNSRNTFRKDNDKYVLTKVDQTIYTYNSNGILESITDKYGNITRITLDSNGNVIKAIDHVNRGYQFNYNNNLLTEITDPMGKTVNYNYNINNLLESVTGVDGIVTTYTYNADNLLISIKHNNNESEKIEYMSSELSEGRVLSHTNELGNIITYSYDQINNITSETDLNNHIIMKHFDREGYVYKIVNPDNTQIQTTYNLVGGFNRYGEELTNTNIYNHKKTYERDEFGRVIKLINHDASFKKYTYNDKNNVIMEVDELGNIIEYIYDNDGVTLLHIVKPIDGFTLYSSNINQIIFEKISYTYYDHNLVNGIKGLLESTTDEHGTIINEYDLYGNLIKKIDSDNNVIKYTNNKLGWKLTEQINDNYITEYQYNDLGKLNKLIKDSKIVAITEYNYRSYPIKEIDGNGNFELFEYDKVGNITKKTDKEGNVTTYSYDLYGNLIKQIEANNSIYIYEYDKLNRLTKKKYQENQVSEPILFEEKTYHNSSNYTITTKTYTTPTDFKTKVETYNYQHKLISEKNESVTKSNNYLKNGLISSEVDNNLGYIYYFYTKTNRLEKKYIMTGVGQYIVTIYRYDNFGRLIEENIGKTKVSSTSAVPTSFISTYYEYNDIGKIIRETTSSGEEINYIYDDFGNIISKKTKIDNDNYQIEEFKYNYLNKVTEEKNGNIKANYEYDLVGNLTKEITGENKVKEYTYNKNYQLTKTILEDVVLGQIYYDNMNNVIRKTDGNGNETKYIYDKKNNLIEEKNAKLISIFHSYDLNNRLIESKDLNGVITTYKYDKFDNVIEKAIGNEIVYKYEYDKNNNLIKEIDPLGNITSRAYDKVNKLLEVIDKMKNYTKYIYDVQFNIISTRNFKNQFTYYAYDERNNLLTKTINNIVIEQNEYNLLNNNIIKVDANGNKENYYYNNSGKLIKKVKPLGYTENYEYDKEGKLIREYTENSNYNKDIYYTYDSNNNIIVNQVKRIETPIWVLSQKLYQYDLNNNLIEENDGKGGITTHEYDSLNNLVKTIKSANVLKQATIYTYDDNNNLIFETNHLGDTKTYVYDDFNNLIETRNELNEITELSSYDLNGRKISSEDALGNIITYVYDNNDNIIEEINQLGYSEKTSYDQLGNILSKTDQNGNITKYEYDINQNLTKVINALNEATTYSYDKNNNLLKVTDARGKTLEYTYDEENNQLSEKDGLGNVEYREYVGDGILRRKIKRDKKSIFYSHDAFRRLTQEENRTHSYDYNNNLILTIDRNNDTERRYDALNRVVSKIENGLTSKYIYDVERYKEKTIDPSGNEVIKEYDKAGRLIKVYGEVEYSYNIDGTLKEAIYDNGALEEYFYNPDKTLSKLINTYDNIIDEYLYTYDQNKNIIKEVTPEEEIINTYDALNRLKTTSVNGTMTTYIYDKSGNRLKEEIGTITKDYIYDSKNQLNQITEKDNNVVTKITTYQYDLNGNLLRTMINGIIDEVNEFNIHDELISTLKNNVETSYEYNSEGKRIAKINNNDKVKFVYEGTSIILEVDENNNELSKNIYGLALISRKNNVNKGCYLYNGHGDTVKIVDELNEVLNTYKYDAWGVILNEVEEFDNPYKYAGYYYDLETSNYYLLSRYYNPSIARFISEDTYKGELDDPLSINRYVYVHNNPLIYYDPDGYAPIPIITGGIGGLFGLGTTFVQDMLDDWKINTNLGTYLGNTVQGTTTGFGLGLCGSACGGIGGLVGDFTNQYINKGKVDLSQSLISGLTTYATSGVFNVGGPVTSTGFNYVKDYAVKGFVAGTTGDVVYQLLSKGVTRDGYGQATGYNPLQAVENYSLGQTLKTGAAGAIMAPVGAKIIKTSIVAFGAQGKITIDRKIYDQMDPRNWTIDEMSNTINNPYTTRESINKANFNESTAYYNKAGDYIVVDNITHKIIQISKIGDAEWTPDPKIINPYKPNK